MKYIHLMAALCAVQALHGEPATPTHTDAHAVALAIKTRIKEHIDPHYHTLRKSSKTAHGRATKEGKAQMRQKQRELQEECNALKEKVYQEYLENQTATRGREHTLLGRLKEIKNLLKEQAPTLAALLESAHEYLSALLEQAALAKEVAVIAALEKEREWLHNLEKTGKKAAISFENPLPDQPKKEKKGAGQKKPK